MSRTLLCCALVAGIVASADEKPCPAPEWTVDLGAKYAFRPFGLVKHPRNEPPAPWRTRQGVTFTGPHTIAIYQVFQNNDLLNAEPRDPSGGGGKYVLQAIFLDAAEGKEVHRLRLTTSSSGPTAIFPTHDGQFIVVTGQILRLYSSKFQEVASRPLPQTTTGSSQNWVISVIPPGRRIYAAGNVTERYLFDADTLNNIVNPQFTDVAFWFQGIEFFPEFGGPRPGVFTPDGHWLALDLSSSAKGHLYWVFLNVPKQDSAAWESKEFRVFSSEGKVLWNVTTRDEINSFSSNGDIVATAIYRHRTNPFDTDRAPTALRISIYDLGTKSERCSIHINDPVSGWGTSRFYDLSSTGNLVVAQGNLLSFYRP